MPADFIRMTTTGATDVNTKTATGADMINAAHQELLAVFQSTQFQGDGAQGIRDQIALRLNRAKQICDQNRQFGHNTMRTHDQMMGTDAMYGARVRGLAG